MLALGGSFNQRMPALCGDFNQRMPALGGDFNQRMPALCGDLEMTSVQWTEGIVLTVYDESNNFDPKNS